MLFSILSSDLQSVGVFEIIGTNCSKQLVKYLKDNGLLPDLQSAYRAGHSTETAMLKVLADILLAIDNGDLAMLTLHDLSAAFDNVDHTTLLERLRVSYGLNDVVLSWFLSYLTDRSQHVRTSGSRSASSAVHSVCLRAWCWDRYYSGFTSPTSYN